MIGEHNKQTISWSFEYSLLRSQSKAGWFIWFFLGLQSTTECSGASGLSCNKKSLSLSSMKAKLKQFQNSRLMQIFSLTHYWIHWAPQGPRQHCRLPIQITVRHASLSTGSTSPRLTLPSWPGLDLSCNSLLQMRSKSWSLCRVCNACACIDARTVWVLLTCMLTVWFNQPKTLSLSWNWACGLKNTNNNGCTNNSINI